MIPAHIIDGPNQEFALRFFDARNKAEFTQKALADKVGIGQRNISLYENGHSFPRGDMLRRLAAVLECDSNWLATGMTDDTQQFISAQYKDKNRASLSTRVEQLSIEDWRLLSPGIPMGLPKYSENPTYGFQSSVLEDFVPVQKTFSECYRATRYPGTYPASPEYPAGSILIFDAGPVPMDSLESGTDVIFRFRGNENKPGLRRFVRELGLHEAMLVSLTSVMTNPIPFDSINVEIIGIVMTQVICRKEPATRAAPGV